MRGRPLVAGLSAVAAAAALLLAGCGGGTSPTASRAHAETPTPSARAAILRVSEGAFFSSSGAPPDLRITSLKEVAAGPTDWARAAFTATPKAPATTRQALAGGHSEGLLQRSMARDWTWLGYLAPGASCRTTAPSAPRAVVRLLSLPPVCASAATPNATPPAVAAGAASNAGLSSPELATLLSLFVTAKNSGASGQVLTPSAIQLSATQPARAASVPGGTEWAMVTYVPAPGAPEPLTAMQLQNGGGTGFFSRQAGQIWVLRGFAGQSFCTGAAAAQVPPAVLALWGHAC